jgi:hypothetical protein
MSRPSFTRLAAALLGGAVLMAVLATAIAFVVYGSWETQEAAVMANTRMAAMVAISAFAVFNATLGLAAVLLLLRLGRTGILAFSLGGAVSGLIFGLVSALAFATPVDPVVLLVLSVVGALMLPLVRALAGIRRQPASPDA